MSRNKNGLTEREYYLIGCFAEPLGRGNREIYRYTAEAERLIQLGHLERAATDARSGKQVFLYYITPKGRATWQAYRFTGP